MPALAASNRSANGPQRNRQQTEARLLQAGVRLMSEEGYEAATTRRIAQAAGVNEQLIARYFGGKEGLLVAILDSYREVELKREREARPIAATVAEEIEAFLCAAEVAGDRLTFARVALARAVVDPRVATAINRLRIDTYLPLVLERLEAHRALGRIRKGTDLNALADALVHLRLGLSAYGQLLFGLPISQLRKIARHSARALTLGIEVNAGPIDGGE